MSPIATATRFRRVEHHMSTAITLDGTGIDDELADRFFARIARLESLLSRFRPQSQISRIAAGRLHRDDADPAVREVLTRCEELRERTDGDFEHEPWRRGDEHDPSVVRLDVNGLAKGWIVEDAAMILRAEGIEEFFVNAGGDVVATRPAGRPAWRVGIQHPADRDAVAAVLELSCGAVATSGTYERGNHLRGRAAAVDSVTVTGPDLAVADALATASWASGALRPTWWDRVAGDHGLLALGTDGRLRWWPPGAGDVPIDGPVTAF